MSHPPAPIDPPDDDVSGSRIGSTDAIVRAAVAVGILCRVVQYAWRRSYWHDEAYLVLNVTSLSYRQLIGALPNAQSAPPGFLVVQRALAEALGSSELVLRLVPLLLGCAGVVMIAALARRLLAPGGAVFAVALFAVSDRLIWHAAEAKQYSGDVFFALLLMLIATSPARNADPAGALALRRLLGVSLVTAAGLWFSHPLVFVFGGIVLARAPGFLRRGWRGAAQLAACTAPAAVSFAALYLLSIRHQQQGALYTYWADDLPDWSHPLTLPLWLLTRLFELGRYPYQRGGEIVSVLAVLGAWYMWRQGRRQLLAMLLAPAALTLLAAMAHRYPFGGSRVTVFLVPAVLLLAGSGAQWVLSLPASARWRPVARGVIVAILVVGLVPAGYHLFVPRHRGHIRPAVEFVRTRRAPGERVYLIGDASPLRCYWRGAEIISVTEDHPLHRVPDSRFWVIAAVGNTRDRERFDDAMASASADVAPPTDVLSYPGGAAYHFVRPRRVPGPATAQVQRPERSSLRVAGPASQP